ncbi:MAG: hypothetical protein Q4C72_03295 [Eubacteriales bacterium]|nr:hypothetical protein [Eubacteriales bacterium]
MKLWKKIVLLVLAVLALAAGSLTVWQWNNIQVVCLFLTQDSETIAQNLEQKREAHQKEIQKIAPVTVAPPSVQQNNDLLSGIADPEQVKEELGIKEQMDKAGSESTAEELINSCVAELYGCKVDIMAQLAVLKKAALDEWNGLPEEERTGAKKRSIGLAGLEACYDLEVAADNRAEQILDSYRVRLKEINADTSALDSLWKLYCEEKASEKAYYLDKYMR